LKQENFGVIVSEPSIHNPRYKKIKEQFEDGFKILRSREYHLVKFDEYGKWKKDIQKIIA
jgi:hypothetical protein